MEFIKRLDLEMNSKYKIIILGITIVIIFILFLRVLNSNKTYQPNQMIGKKIPEFILENLLNKNPKLDSNILSGKDLGHSIEFIFMSLYLIKLAEMQ